MINLSDFQPLSIAKIKKVSSTTGFLLKIFSDKVHAILIEEITVQSTLPDGASVRRLSRIIAGEPERGSCLFFIIGPELSDVRLETCAVSSLLISGVF